MMSARRSEDSGDHALYFTLYLRKIVSEINEARNKIREYQGLLDLMAQEKPVEYVPIN